MNVGHMSECTKYSTHINFNTRVLVKTIALKSQGPVLIFFETRSHFNTM